MLSSANGPSSGWVTILPSAKSTCLIDDHFLLAGRHLWAYVWPREWPHNLVSAVTAAENPEHAMVYKPSTRTIKLHDDMYVSA